MEHIFLRVLIATLLIFLGACNNVDPNPELRDPILKDINAQMGAAERSLGDASKALGEAQHDLSMAIPQSGQFKRRQKKVFEFEKQVDLFKQQIKYWKIRSEERAKMTRKEYTRAMKEGKPWPDPKEYATYLSEKKLRLAKINWDSKERIEDFQKEAQQKLKTHGMPAGEGASGGH